MKKLHSLPALFLVLTALFVSGCANSGPSSPAATPTAVPTATPVTAANGVFENFTDGDLSCSIGAVTGTWSAGNDSATGGTSTIASFGVVNDTFIQLGLTATVETSIDLSAGGFAALSPGYNKYGYVYHQLDFSGPVNLTANNPSSFQLYIYAPVGSGLNYRIYAYDNLGRSCWTDYFPIPATRTNYGITFAYMSIPALSSYTALDVLAAATKIQIVYQYKGYNFNSQSVSVYIDAFGAY